MNIGLILRITLSLGLLASAALKINWPDPQSLLGDTGSRIAGGLELAVAASLFTPQWRTAIAATVALAAAGVILAWFLPGTSCGCFGRFRLGRSTHLLAAALMGLVALKAWDQARYSVRRHEPT